MTPGAAPRPPRWALWALRRLLSPADLRVIRGEMEELFHHWCRQQGPHEARRRFLRQWRQYPWRLMAARLGGHAGAVPPRRVGDVGPAGPWITPQTLVQTVRSLGRAPGLSGAIVMTVGLGIGGCTTIFAVVDALYLQPLPYGNVQDLFWIYTDSPPNRFPFSVADFQALKAQQTSFSTVAAQGRNRRTYLTPDGSAELLPTLEATPGLLDMWGVDLLVGRMPTEAEGAPGAAPTVLVTRAFAQQYLGAGPDGAGVVGATLDLDGEPHSVLGVLGSSLGPLARNVNLVPTLRLQPPSRKGPFFLRAYGRLAPQVTPEAARAELQALNTRLFPVWADSYQDQNASWGLLPVEEYVRGNAGPLLAVLMGAVAMVLLIALANAANLLVTRLNARSRELAVRTALGASRSRILGHLLAEGAILAMGGVAVGLVAARLGVATLPELTASYLQRADEARLTSNVILFSLALAALASLLFALIPALRRGGDRAMAGDLRSGGRAGPAPSRQRTQRILVVAQVAVVVPLLSGAFLLLGSFLRLQDVDPGFHAEEIVTLRASLSPGSYPEDVDRERFWTTALERIEAIPGVVRAALASERPPDQLNDLNNFQMEDRPTPPGQPERLAAWVVVGTTYFEAMGIPLLEGRDFTAADLEDDAPPVVLVDEAWARQNYPGESPVGRRMYSGGQTSGPRTTVIGVVGHVPYEGVGTSRRGTVYQAITNRFSVPYVFVRSQGDGTGSLAAVQDELRRLDSTIPITEAATGEDLLESALARPRHLSFLAGLFALVAVVLAVVGLYGVTAHSVQQRRGDIAVRLALGGDPSAVLRMTLWDGVRLALVGLLVGGGAALMVSDALASLLYQVTPRDLSPILGAGGVLLAVSVAATLLPALRALRVDPASALREE